jgi:hypothetical protein
MRDKKRSRPEQTCDELRPDDGVDPRILFRRETRTRNQSRKDGQLCKQTFRVLSLAFDQLAAEGWAEGLYLARVTPAPDASRLRLAIAFAEPCTLDEAEAVLRRLRGLGASLRWELAAGIARRRVPELVFGLAGAEEGDDGER